MGSSLVGRPNGEKGKKKGRKREKREKKMEKKRRKNKKLKKKEWGISFAFALYLIFVYYSGCVYLIKPKKEKRKKTEK